MLAQSSRAGDTWAVATRIGFVIILAGVALIVARAFNWVDSEAADIAATLAIVLGALAVAVGGEDQVRT